MHPNTTLGPVNLVVQDLSRSIAFYEQIIGFSEIQYQNNEAYLYANKDALLIRLKEDKEAKPVKERSHAGLYHFALLVPDRESLATIVKHLALQNVPLGGADHLVSEAVYLSDPDGNGIEIYRDRPRKEWTYDASGYINMATLALDGDGLIEEAGVWKGLPKGTVMGHVHMHVANLQEAEAFFEELLGFDVVSRFGGQALFMSAGGYHHHLGFNTWAGEGAVPQEKPAAGMESYTIVLANDEEWDRVLGRFRGQPGTEERGDSLAIQDPSRMTIIFEKTQEKLSVFTEDTKP
ncbi:VOC family protein [Shouchella shacheensis]|uniref:VOC family protein n=1 Tax=Shouchella shacheensis TaxID=1649580 RepID=UPI0007401956|nr:VOC family protein [Shouchella shacheensis]